MNKKETVLAGLAAGSKCCHTYTPVQVQKMFFLIDKNIPQYIDGPQFDFKPYDYGPFDKEVYSTIEDLAKTGDAIVKFDGRKNLYELTEQGLEKGNAIWNQLPPLVKEYLTNVSEYVRSLSFTELVSSIYQAYPEMRVHSVFKG
ncbi:MAG: hypothetical protein ACE15F_13395 [bacterium]